MTEMQKDLERYLAFCAAKGVTQRGLEIVEDVISNPPARRVNTRSMAPNHTVRFTSRKMGMTIQAESMSLEWSSIYIKEFDGTVLGFWDQPFHRPNLFYKSKNRSVRTSSTLDFFVISDEFIGFEECKSEEDLLKEIKKPSERYKFDDNRMAYVIPPLAEYLDGTGLGQRVFTDRDVNLTHVENLALLYDLLDEPVSFQDKQLWAIARRLSNVSGGIKLVELEDSVRGLSRTSVLTAIALKELYADLYNQDLRNPDRIRVYASPDCVVIKGDVANVELQASQMSGSPADMAEALDRLKSVNAVLQGVPIGDVALRADVCVRTVQRWKAAYLSGDLRGLEPRNRDKGNYGSKLDSRVETCIYEIIEEIYMANEAKTAAHVYGLVKKQCEERKLRPPSREAFNSRLEEIDDCKKNKIREGAKRAYQFTAYKGVEAGKDYPFRTVSRFLERCHIDHTQADIQLYSDEGATLEKPWLTVITDEFSGFVLAIYLSFQKPSTVSVMSVIRLMVFKHGVFPEAIVVDGGKEFESTYFETLMARRRCTVISRKGKPRSGSAVERTFGTINTILLDNLTGNNKLAKHVRQLSSSHNPKGLAVWGAVDFYHGLVGFIDDWNCKSAKTGGLSPAELKAKSIERFGMRQNRVVKYDQDFVQDVLPAPKRRTVTLRRNQKIHVNRVPYWHGCLRSAPKSGVNADVRYDPFDLNYVYVFHHKEWLKFKATRPQHSKLDELEKAIVAEVARESLAVNERAQAEVRPEFSDSVENLNRQAKERYSARDRNFVDPVNNQETMGGIVSGGHPDEQDIWGIDIPESVEAD